MDRCICILEVQQWSTRSGTSPGGVVFLLLPLTQFDINLSKCQHSAGDVLPSIDSRFPHAFQIYLRRQVSLPGYPTPTQRHPQKVSVFLSFCPPLRSTNQPADHPTEPHKQDRLWAELTDGCQHMFLLLPIHLLWPPFIHTPNICQEGKILVTPVSFHIQVVEMCQFFPVDPVKNVFVPTNVNVFVTKQETALGIAI
ncbi:hypothetical protein EGR_03675 [Echinococcus granulosus]|uniref:Uncharacterized protein n=1 Tax=Echinococcus granulosus TaxID=6210 RepID=W6UIR0_ECHGR|nr:hypothetical protein EGR_03675 [Echinococcus granulosus]EUB61385.1 hypothetical protein EGR_03675 [Echinococcus granulosus]